jgi:PadR family transcriptional regulator PadR
LFDQESVNKKFQKEINAGIASLVLLSVMQHASEPLYGYQIAKLIAAGKENGLSMKQSALYPVLRSMESNGLLSSRVEPSVSGPPRKYYSITENGKYTLKDWQTTWEFTKSYVDLMLKGVYSD